MSNRNPLVAYQGEVQGRMVPLTSYGPVDGAYVYVLGSETLQVHDYAEGAFVAIDQDLDMSGIDVIRFAFGMKQPSTMPEERVISGNPASATLRASGVYPDFHPFVVSKVKSSFKVPKGAKLVVEVDGGGNQTVVFPETPSTGHTPGGLCGILNAQLTGAAASITGDEDDPTVTLTAASQGAGASLEVKDYGGPEGDANDNIAFSQKVGSPSAYYGRDALYAIIAPDGALTQADVGRTVELNGCTTAANNMCNRIMAVLDDGVTGILHYQVAAEAAGFTAKLLGYLWTMSVSIDDQIYWQSEFFRGCDVKTEDLAINVSKLSGTHKLTFRLELPLHPLVAIDTVSCTDAVATLKV